MNKNQRMGIKKLRLTVARETVLILTSDQLKNVAGGAIPLTRTGCDTVCMVC